MENNYYITLVHIDQICSGDTIEHEGKIVTVTNNDIKKDKLFGRTIFGDSYHIGYRKVKKVNYYTI